MSLKDGRKFSTGASSHRQRQMSTLVEKEGIFGPSLTVCGNLLDRFAFNELSLSCMGVGAQEERVTASWQCISSCFALSTPGL